MAGFAADPAFDGGSVFMADWPLCQLRLQDDARFPWLILIPRVAGAVELDDLSPADRARLMEEIVRAGHLVRAEGEAAGRRCDDGLWPDPVWGRDGARPYDALARAAVLARLAA